MNLLKFGRFGVETFFGLVQILLLFSYLTLNIVNVGDAGVGLPLLASFFFFAISIVVFKCFYNSIYFYKHFFIFLLFIFWLSFRVVIDLNDLERLKQLTIATTGGIFLFFLIGTFARSGLDYLSNSLNNTNIEKLLLILFFLMSVFIFHDYSNRLVRADIFYIDDVNGGYQRPGNFIIIFFLMVSFIFLKKISSNNFKKKISIFFWFIIYTLGMMLLLVNSQMIGSNAATVNLVVMYLLTMAISFLGSNKEIKRMFLNNKISLSFSKILMKKTLGYVVISFSLIIVLGIVVISISNFDLNSTRAFGFGEGNNSSLNSRMAILMNTGIDQLSYAPILGNTNVAYLTTGNSGTFLHSFMLNITSELGLLGLTIVSILFYNVLKVIFRNIKTSDISEKGFQNVIVNLWLIVLFFYFFVYANFAVSKSWLVMWFFIGFSVKIFGFKTYVKKW